MLSEYGGVNKHLFARRSWQIRMSPLNCTKSSFKKGRGGIGGWTFEHLRPAPPHSQRESGEREKWVVHQWQKEGAFVRQAQWRTFCCEHSATFNTLMPRCRSWERAVENQQPDPADLRQTDAVFTARLIPADLFGQKAAAASQSGGAGGGGGRRGWGNLMGLAGLQMRETLG